MTRKEFLKTLWDKDHPQYANLSYLDVMAFIGRSKQLQSWLVNAETEFEAISIAPEWFINGGFSPKDWNEFKSTYEEVIRLRSIKSTSLNVEATKYRSACDKIDNDFQINLGKVMVNPVIEISCITFEDLPDDVIFKGLSLDNKSVDGSMSKKSVYEHEQLINYKTYLLKQFKLKGVHFKFSDYVSHKVK